MPSGQAEADLHVVMPRVVDVEAVSRLPGLSGLLGTAAYGIDELCPCVPCVARSD